MLFVPTDKVNLYPNEDDDNEIGGSIVAFMPIEKLIDLTLIFFICGAF